MARPLRIEYPGAFYHVMNRGTERCLIFHDPTEDRSLFKATIGETVEKWNIQIHAFALMENHYHLLVETPLGNLNRAMKHIDGVYTQRFNRKYKRDGSLFRGRYKSILVEKESYFLELVRYIHLNSVRALLAPRPELDRSCSHFYYLYPQTAPNWLEKRLVLSYFKDHSSPQKALDKFVKAGIDTDLENKLKRKRWPAILGTTDFIDLTRQKYLDNIEENMELSNKKEIFKTLNPKMVLKEVNHFFEAPQSKKDEVKKIWILSYMLRKYSQKSVKEISKIINVKNYYAVSKVLRRKDFSRDEGVVSLEKRLDVKMSNVQT